MKVLRKTVLVTGGGTSSLSVNLNIGFIPHDFIVRQISSFNGAPTNDTYVIISSLNNNQPICIISDTNGTESLSNTFSLPNPIQGTYTFELINAQTNTQIAFPPRFNILLEFIRYI